MKGKGLIDSDAMPQSGRHNSLEFIAESLHFSKADNQVGFYIYKLFILWVEPIPSKEKWAWDSLYRNSSIKKKLFVKGRKIPIEKKQKLGEVNDKLTFVR